MIIEFHGKKPSIAVDSFVAENATIIGDVLIARCASIWYGAVLRGDINSITVGEFSNIQDLCAVHVDKDKPVSIGKYVIIGHGAVIHGSTIGDRALIGMGATVLDGTTIGEGAIVAAGALVPPNKKIKPRTLVAGVPATFIKELSDEDFENLKHHAEAYWEYAKLHKNI